MLWCGSYVGFPKIMHQSAAGLWHPFRALLFVICIISSVIILKNGYCFPNKRKVAASISRIKVWLAGIQCKVMKIGKEAESSMAFCTLREE